MLSRSVLKRLIFGVVIIPYNGLLSVIVTVWLIASGAFYGSARRLTSPRRWVWYPTFGPLPRRREVVEPVS